MSMPRFNDRPRQLISLGDDDPISTRQLTMLRDLVNFLGATRNHPHMCCDATPDEWKQLVDVLNS